MLPACPATLGRDCGMATRQVTSSVPADPSWNMLRNLGALGTGHVASKLAALVSYAWLARSLGPEYYGTVEFAMALAAFFVMIVEFGLDPIGVRDLAQDCYPAGSLAGNVPAAKLVVAVFAAPCMLLYAWAAGQSGAAIGLVAVLALTLFIVPLEQRWLLQGCSLMGCIAAGQMLRALVFLGGVTWFVGAPCDLLAVGWSEAAAALSAAGFYLFVQQRRITPLPWRCSWPQIRRLLREGLPVGLSDMAWAINQFLPIGILVLFSPATEVSWFGSANRVVVSLLALSRIYHFNLYPTMARKAGESAAAVESVLRRSFRLVAWGAILAAMGLTLCGRPLLELAFGEPFAPAALVLAIVVWTFPITALSGHARWALIASGRRRYVLGAQLAGLAATLLFGLVLAPRFGALGAAIASLAGYVAVWGVAHAYAGRHVGCMPLLPVMRPALAALLIGCGTAALLGCGWAAAVAAMFLYVLCAWLADGELRAELFGVARGWRHLL